MLPKLSSSLGCKCKLQFLVNTRWPSYRSPLCLMFAVMSVIMTSATVWKLNKSLITILPNMSSKTFYNQFIILVITEARCKKCIVKSAKLSVLSFVFAILYIICELKYVCLSNQPVLVQWKYFYVALNCSTNYTRLGWDKKLLCPDIFILV